MSALQQALQAPPSDCFSGCVSMLPVLWDQPWGDTTSAGSQTACFMMKAGSRAPCVSIAHHLGKDHARCWLGKLCWRMLYMASNFLSMIELYMQITHMVLQQRLPDTLLMHMSMTHFAVLGTADTAIAIAFSNEFDPLHPQSGPTFCCQHICSSTRFRFLACIVHGGPFLCRRACLWVR